MKKAFSLLLSLVLLLSFAHWANAETTEETQIQGEVLASELKSMSKSQVKSNKKDLKQQIYSLSNEEFDSFMYNYVRNNPESVTSMQETLNSLDVEFSMKEKSSPEFSTYALGASNLILDVYSAKRTGESFYRLYASWDATASESRPATYDIISLEWNPKYGVYYSSVVGDEYYASKKDGTNRLNGIYLFNVYDEKYNFDSYVGVYVTKNTTGWLDYGSKFTHTYNTTSTTTSGSASFQWAGTGPTGGVTYTVTTSTIEAKWEKYEDNAVYLP